VTIRTVKPAILMLMFMTLLFFLQNFTVKTVGEESTVTVHVQDTSGNPVSSIIDVVVVIINATGHEVAVGHVDSSGDFVTNLEPAKYVAIAVTAYGLQMVKGFQVPDTTYIVLTYGYVTVFVEYSDGVRVEGADVKVGEYLLGKTDSSGQVERLGVVPPGTHVAKAYYPAAVEFGSTFITVDDVGTGGATIVGSYPSPPSVPEFPFGLTIEIALIPVIFYVWWKRKQGALQ